MRKTVSLDIRIGCLPPFFKAQCFDVKVTESDTPVIIVTNGRIPGTRDPNVVAISPDEQAILDHKLAEYNAARLQDRNDETSYYIYEDIKKLGGKLARTYVQRTAA